PLTVDSSVTVLYGALAFGGCLHLISTEHALDAPELATYFERWGIECLKIAPSHLASLVKQSADAGAVLPNRQLAMGGEPCEWDFVTELRAAGDCQIYNHYGPTETTVGVLLKKISSVETGALAAGTVPLGRPLENTGAYIVGRHGELQVIGAQGELYI